MAQGLDLPAILPRPIVWLGDGPPDEQQAHQIAEAVKGRPGENSRAVLARLEQFVDNFPHSGWTPSLREALAEHASQHLHYERAMSHWAANLQALREERRPDRKAAADRALAFLARHLLIAGEVEKLGPLLDEFRLRGLDEGPLSAMQVRTAQKYRRMLRYPTRSYKCGLFALDRLAVSLGWQYPRQGLRGEPSAPEGLSLLDLQKIASRYGLGVVPVRADQPGLLPVPSVMHTRLGHFVTLLEQRNGTLFVFDPGAKTEAWIPREDVAEEATGRFLVPGPEVPLGFTLLDADEAARWRGRTTSCPPNHAEDEDCDEGDGVEWNDGAADDTCPAEEPGEEECNDCCGAAVAVVKRHSLNLFIKDRPLIYRPSKGPMIYPKMRFKRYNETFYEASQYYLGGNWRLGFQMGLIAGEATATVFRSGGVRIYTFPWFEGNPGYYGNLSDPHPRDGSRLRKGDSVNPWRLEFINGRVIEFGGPLLAYWKLPSRLVNRLGHGLQLNYDGNNRLSSITDADNQSTYFDFADFFGETRLWRIRTPDSRTASFNYLQTAFGNVLLASITDATGLVSSFTYPDEQHPNFPYAQGVPHTITTPYGTTSFDYATGQTSWDDFVVITDPAGGRRAYALLHDALGGGKAPPDFAPWQLPLNPPDPNTGYAGTSTIDTVNRGWNLSLYWAPRALDVLLNGSNPDPDNWGWTEMKQARIWSWLADPNWFGHVTDMPNYVQEPSPDGVTEGPITFFDYPGKPAPEYPGTSRWPSVTTRRLPNGETWWSYTPHNAQGRILERRETYTQSNGTVGVRTVATYTYAANGYDLLEERDGSNQLRKSYTWDANHRILTQRAYFGPGANDFYETTYTYDPLYGLPATQTDPTGLITTWTYTPAPGGANGYTVTKSTAPVAGTETEVWSNGRRISHTDVLGFTRTFTYDALDRVTRIDYPDATYETFSYIRSADGAPLLDLVKHRDRMGYETRYTYDGARRLTTVTDRRGKVTTYTYCPCGSLERITDPRGNITEFAYDQVGRRTGVTVKRPDGTIDTTTSSAYNLLGQLTSETVTIQGQHSVRAFAYNHQGLRISTSVNGWLTEKNVYDVEDRPWQVTDRNGVTLTHAYDGLGRRVRTDYPGGGGEELGYTARGLTEHRRKISPTLTAVTTYGYDEAQRKISETSPNNETLTYTYDAAGNLLTLTDGRDKTTTWTYDLEGRLWKKRYHGQNFDNVVYAYNANGWLISRRFYSSSTTYRETLYEYDPNGNLTLVNYPAPTVDVSFAYDEANRVVEMKDAYSATYGTAARTTFTYNAAGARLTENGPRSGTPDPDLLTYSYTNNSAGLRTSLTLNQPGGGAFTLTYGYDLARRLVAVTSPAGTFSYTYQPVSVGGASYAAGLVQQIALPGTLKIVNNFNDPLVRLIQTEFRDAANAVKNSHTYTYNLGSQRTSHTRGGNGHAYGGTTDYTYDPNGQLLTASLESLTYSYDPGWNMVQRNTTAYTVNHLNQVTSDGTWTYSYDANGNRTYRSGGGGWLQYLWDDENQLSTVQTDTSGTPEAYRFKTEMVYDGLRRLRRVRQYNWQYGGWYGPMSQVEYLYDGLLLLQERVGNPQVSYTRGLDLSGTLEGAGGIGGLLARSRHATGSPYAVVGSSFYHADGNGNVTYLAGSTGGADAAYRYDPFGRWQAQTGPYAAANGLRFSSKLWLGYNGSNTDGLYSFGYRFYEPYLQRWLNRDPIGEAGGVNFYAYVYNSPLNYIDPDGDEAVSIGISIGVGAGATGGTIGAVGTGGIALWGAGWSYVGYEIGDRTGFHDWLAEQLAKGYVVCMSRPHGKGERNWGHESDNPWKGWRVDPNDPTKIRGRDPRDGKWKTKPRPPGFPDPKPQPSKPKPVPKLPEGGQ